jgi:hypothetical protein
MQSLKRIGKPDDAADVIAFLSSDGAQCITGANTPVNGGSKLSRPEALPRTTYPAPTDVLILRSQNGGGAYIPFV